MLDILNETEQVALLELLTYMAKADGDVEDIEEEVLEQYAMLMDIELDSLKGDMTPAELVPMFETPASRVAVLQELLRLSHLDGHFAADEKAAIIDIAEQMEVPLDIVQRVDEWVVEGLDWVWRGEELLDEAEKQMD